MRLHWQPGNYRSSLMRKTEVNNGIVKFDDKRLDTSNVASLSCEDKNQECSRSFIATLTSLTIKV